MTLYKFEDIFGLVREIALEHRFTLDSCSNRYLHQSIVNNKFCPYGYVLMDQDSLMIWTFPNLTQALYFAKNYCKQRRVK